MGANKPVGQRELDAAQRAVDATKSKRWPQGNMTKAARKLGLPRSTLIDRLDLRRSGRSAETLKARMPTEAERLQDCAVMLRDNPKLSAQEYANGTKLLDPWWFHSHMGSWNAFKHAAMRSAGLRDTVVMERVKAALRKGGTLAELGASSQASRGQVLDAIDALRSGGAAVDEVGDRYAIGHAVLAPSFAAGPVHQYVSRKDNTFLFGAISDNHIGSKYERLDAAEDIYDRFVAAGVDRVYNCGNWIEGEARFNRTEIHTHGMDAQLAYFAKHYPRRKGLTTYAVSGDDHEGWYCQREGLDIGKRAEQTMRAAGRSDWVDLGFMEAHVKLTNANSGKSAILAVVHPGGGSAYADSYAVQKVIESLDGGEKPAVALYGHWHKMLAGEYRNVWWVLVPSTKDQDTFMRKKRIRSVVGGGIIGLEQDPNTGAITGMTPKLWRYFNRGYYENDRWSHSGSVVLPARTAA